jgi:iron only hydrogenase large subunit-like protein
MTTSCCPAWVNLVNKHMPEMKPFVSETPSPMVYTARYVKANMPDAITVFVSPCVGKRSEVYRTPEVDYVVSFEELGSWFMARNIDVMKCESAELDTTINSDGRRFAYTNGVMQSVKNYVEHPEEIKDIVISGLDKATIRTLKGYVKSCPGNFVEVMSCAGGCVNGCDVIANPRVATRQVDNFAKSMEEGK